METEQQTREDMNQLFAEEVLGWRWMSFIGRPVRGHKQYNDPNCRVRQFMSPKSLNDPRWAEHLQRNDGRPADGTEPLAYCYCSSSSVEMPPPVAFDWNAAMKLAEEWNLLRSHYLFQRENGSWSITGKPSNDDAVFSIGNTGPEAICGAVLKLHRRKSS